MTFYAGSRSGCHWQVLVGPPDEASWTQLIDRLIGLADVVEPGDIVLDLWFNAGMPSAQNRARFTREFAQSAITERVSAHVLVTNSSLSRGVLTAINWVIKRPFQERIFALPDDGLAWVATLKPDLDIGALRRDIETAVPGYTALRW